jgi:hypothetical protein
VYFSEGYVQSTSKCFGALYEITKSDIEAHVNSPGKQSTAPVEKQHTPRTSTKAIQCPFEIQYSFLSVVKSKDDPSWRPDLFYQAKITFAEYNHLWSMTPQAHCLALIRSGRTQPSLEGMKNIISLMQEKPHVEHTSLCAMLRKYIPDFKSLDVAFTTTPAIGTNESGALPTTTKYTRQGTQYEYEIRSWDI